MVTLQEARPPAGNPAVVRPPCPNCGRSMHLTRTMRRTGLPDLRIFSCGECGVCSTEATPGRDSSAA